MKISVILFLIAFLTIEGTRGQNFAPVGAKWHYTQNEFLGPGLGYFSFESVKDTLVQGQPCRKIAGNSGCFWISEFMFDRNDSVFFYHPQREEFCLLYDFGATVGDMWTVYHYNLDSTVVRVDSLGVSNVDGHNLRVIHTTALNQGENLWEFGGRMTERIGVMFPVMGFCDPTPGDLRCYEDSVISLQQGPYECEEIISSVDQISLNDIRVYPNPFDTHLNFDLPIIGQGVARYTISTIDGRILMQGELDAENENATLYLEHLSKGMYILNLLHNNKSFHFNLFKS